MCERRALLATKGVYNSTGVKGATPKRAPALLWLLGEQGVSVILINEQAIAEPIDLERARSLFPEAAITPLPGP